MTGLASPSNFSSPCQSFQRRHYCEHHHPFGTETPEGAAARQEHTYGALRLRKCALPGPKLRERYFHHTTARWHRTIRSHGPKPPTASLACSVSLWITGRIRQTGQPSTKQRGAVEKVQSLYANVAAKLGMSAKTATSWPTACVPSAEPVDTSGTFVGTGRWTKGARVRRKNQRG